MTTNNSHPSAWQAFLDEVFPDKEDQKLAQRLFGEGVKRQTDAYQDRPL